jgi:hypothetical protein
MGKEYEVRRIFLYLSINKIFMVLREIMTNIVRRQREARTAEGRLTANNSLPVNCCHFREKFLFRRAS